jgi:hypothetical protein
MRFPRVVASTICCVLALSLTGCAYQQTATLFRAHDDAALRAHVQVRSQ